MAVVTNMSYDHTLYGKLFQGLHIAESIFEGHLRDKSWSRVRFSVKNLHQAPHATTIITNNYSTISTMSTFVNSLANLIFGHFQRAVSTSQQPQLLENLSRYQVASFTLLSLEANSYNTPLYAPIQEISVRNTCC